MAPAQRQEVRLFVYGTLLSGLPNHGWLRGAPLLGAATTADAWRLVDMGGYPALVDAAGATPVAGELYAGDDALLAHLDVLEDVPDLYRRASIRLNDGMEAVAYVLVAGRAPAHAPVIDHGDYRRWLADGHGRTRADDAADDDHRG